MALAWRRPWDGSRGPTLLARRWSPWNRANWARGLLSTVQINTAMWPWLTSRRADSFGGSGGSAGTEEAQVTPSPVHYIPAAPLCPIPPPHTAQARPFPCSRHLLVSPNSTPAWLLPLVPPPQASQCPMLPLPITHRAHSGPRGWRAGHQPRKGCGRHRGQHLFWTQAAASWSPGAPGPTVPHSGTRRS